MSDAPQEDVAHHFAALWKLLDPRADDENSGVRRLMLDQVRRALDTGANQLDIDRPVEWIAGTFIAEDRLSRTATTEVLRVRHRDLGSVHALKRPLPEYRADPVLQTMILHEARIGLSLRHPCLVQTQMLFRLGDGRPAILMEQCGASVLDICRERRLTIDEVLSILDCTFQALAHLDGLGFAHGDLSPANLLRSGEETAWKLGDFGLSRARGDGFPDAGIARAGTAGFVMTEDTLAGQPHVTPDLYAVGRLVAFLLDHCGTAGSMAGPLRQLGADLCGHNPVRAAEAHESLVRIMALSSGDSRDGHCPGGAGSGAAAVGGTF